MKIQEQAPAKINLALCFSTLPFSFGRTTYVESLVSIQ